MTPAERRTACIRLLAEIDQLIAECEDLADQPVVADDEREYLAVHLQFRGESGGSGWRRCSHVLVEHLLEVILSKQRLN